jgi:hypothetical protein
MGSGVGTGATGAGVGVVGSVDSGAAGTSAVERQPRETSAMMMEQTIRIRWNGWDMRGHPLESHSPRSRGMRRSYMDEQALRRRRKPLGRNEHRE